MPLLHRLPTTRNGGGSVPVLVQGSDRFIDSTDIVRHADALGGGDLLYPRDAAQRREVEALVERFDKELGTHTRRWAYAQLLPAAHLLRPMMTRGVPWLEAKLLPLILPGVSGLIRSQLRITPESAQRSIERVRGVFREVGERLSDGRRFLVGERFTAADLTFAALAAPVLFPADYRGAYPALDVVPCRDARRGIAPARHRRRALRAAPVLGGARRRTSRSAVVRANQGRRGDSAALIGGLTGFAGTLPDRSSGLHSGRD